MSNQSISRISKYYNEKLTLHGSTPLGVDWNGESSQFQRFGELCKVVDTKKNFSIKLDTVTKEISKNTWNKAVKHYLLFLISKNDLDIVYKKMDKIKNESTWVFCIHDLNHNNCDLSENFKIYKIINFVC